MEPRRADKHLDELRLEEHSAMRIHHTENDMRLSFIAFLCETAASLINKPLEADETEDVCESKMRGLAWRKGSLSGSDPHYSACKQG